MSPEDDDKTPVLITPTLVFHLYERLLKPGVHKRVADFFIWWSVNGPFPLTIPATGGVRTNELVQAGLYAKGRTTPGPLAGEEGYPELGLTVTNARTLDDTPHGPRRRAAADAEVAVVKDGQVVATLTDTRVPKIRLQYEHYGLLAEEHGLEWGGRWRNKDMCHVQVRDWRTVAPPVVT